MRLYWVALNKGAYITFLFSNRRVTVAPPLPLYRRILCHSHNRYHKLIQAHALQSKSIQRHILKNYLTFQSSLCYYVQERLVQTHELHPSRSLFLSNSFFLARSHYLHNNNGSVMRQNHYLEGTVTVSLVLFSFSSPDYLNSSNSINSLFSVIFSLFYFQFLLL